MYRGGYRCYLMLFSIYFVFCVLGCVIEVVRKDRRKRKQLKVDASLGIVYVLSASQSFCMKILEASWCGELLYFKKPCKKDPHQTLFRTLDSTFVKGVLWTISTIYKSSHRKCSTKKLFLKISQYSPKSTRAGISF